MIDFRFDRHGTIFISFPDFEILRTLVPYQPSVKSSFENGIFKKFRAAEILSKMRKIYFKLDRQNFIEFKAFGYRVSIALLRIIFIKRPHYV